MDIATLVFFGWMMATNLAILAAAMFGVRIFRRE